MNTRTPLFVAWTLAVLETSIAQEQVDVYDNPNALFALRMGPLGDLTGDGIQELGVSGYIGTSGSFEILSGSDGTVIGEVSVGTDHFIDRIAPAGDVDNDGVDDFLITDVGQISRDVIVISGATFGGLHGYSRPVDQFVFDFFGSMPAGGSDLNNDGHDDFYINDPFQGVGRFYSGATGQVLRTLAGTPVVHFVSDVNGDENGDYVATQLGFVQWFSGADDSLLHASHGVDSGFSLTSLRLLSDRNGDGVQEIVATAATQGSTVSRIYVLDGMTGASLGFAEAPPETTQFFTLNPAGDMNGDGFEDFAFGTDSSGDREQIALYSGRDFDLLYLWESDESLSFGAGTAALGDRNGDGADEIAFSSREGNGLISIRGGRELFLNAPDLVGVTEQITLRTAGGEPGKISGLFLTEVNGSPLVFRPSPLVLLNAVGASQETLPMPFFPVELTFLSFAKNAENKVVVSGSEVVRVE